MQRVSVSLERTDDVLMIKFTQKGNFRKTSSFLKRLGNGDYYQGLDIIAQQGVEALMEATPRDTGKTAESWSYSIVKTKDKVSITWNNSNINDGVSVAALIQYGHGTPQGVYIEGIDYINPALKPIFEKLGSRVWEEVTRDA